MVDTQKEDENEGQKFITIRKWNYFKNKFTKKRSIRLTNKYQKVKLFAIRQFFSGKSIKIIYMGVPMVENPTTYSISEVIFYLSGLYKYFNPTQLDSEHFIKNGIHTDNFIRKVIDWSPKPDLKKSAKEDIFFKQIKQMMANRDNVVNHNVMDKQMKVRKDLIKSIKIGSIIDIGSPDILKQTYFETPTINSEINKHKQSIKAAKGYIKLRVWQIKAHQNRMNDLILRRNELNELEKTRKEARAKSFTTLRP